MRLVLGVEEPKSCAPVGHCGGFAAAYVVAREEPHESLCTTPLRGYGCVAWPRREEGDKAVKFCASAPVGRSGRRRTVTTRLLPVRED